MSYSKFFPSSMVLETPRATLRLMKTEDIPTYQALAIYPETFKYFTRDLSIPDDFDRWMNEAFDGRAAETRVPFTVIDALLSYAFDVLNFERVEVKTDVLNLRARAALKKIGMVEEGVLRSHTLMHSDRRRDTIFYSILSKEWAEVKEKYFHNI
jgi:hypothetical protein